MRDRCEPFLERLGRYLDGELEAEAAREMEDHLRSCARCRRALEQAMATDRLLRGGLRAEIVDEEREAEATARLLARLREEPEPEWARRESAGRETGSRLWRRLTSRIRSRGLGPTLGWAGGLAAATAAVLLAIRLGMPEHRIATDQDRGGKVEQAPADQRIEQVPGQANGEGTGRPQEAPPTAAEGAAPSVDRYSLGQPPTGAGSPAPRLEAGAEKSAHEAPSEARDVARGKAKEEEGALSPAVRPAPLDDAALSTDEPEPAPAEDEARIAAPVQSEKKDDAAAGERGNALRARGSQGSEPGAAWRKIRSLSEAPSASSSDLAVRASRIDSSQEGIFSSVDTLTEAPDLPARLERGSRALQSMTDSDLDRAERARRWRVIGDLWEWLARRDGSAAFFERALEAYETGVAIDAEAGAPDSARAARARLGAGHAPAAPEAPGVRE